MALRVARAVALGCALTASLALAGCEKPTPIVTLNAGGESVHAEALCWNRGGGTVSEQDCRAGATPRLRVDQPDGIGISVEPDLAENGWTPSIGDRALVPKPLTTTYFRVPVNGAAITEPVELRIYASDASHKGRRGLWAFEIVPR